MGRLLSRNRPGMALEDNLRSGEGFGEPVPFPVPVKGWNARDPIADMDPRFALRLDNIIPRSYYCEWRLGQENWLTAIPTATKSLLRYTSPTAKKLFAAAGAAIYDSSVAGAVGAPVVAALTSDQWQDVMFSNSGGYYLVICNGSDPVQNYDGAAWSVPVITNVSSNDLENVWNWKTRLWFTKKSSLSAWYLPISAIAGAATEFPLGPLFKKGGSLLAIGSITFDSGTGPDDRIAFFTTEGEVAIFAGTDPASGLNLIGTYQIPKPVGKRCLLPYGGDLLVLTEQGVYPLSKAIQSSSINRATELTYNISPVFQSDASLYGSSFGWQMALFSEQNLLIVNVPSTAMGGLSLQYVMNTLTGAWCRFVNISGYCLSVFDGKLIFGGAAKTFRALSASSDFGVKIKGELFTAFSRLGKTVRNKHLKMLRPHMLIDGALTMDLAVLTDFQINPDYQRGDIVLGGGAGGIWDTSVWDGALWGFGDFNPLEWKTVFANPASALAIGLRAHSNSVTIKASSFDLLFEAGGVAL